MIPLNPSNVHDPLSFDIGDDWILEFDCNDASGNPLDLTGASIEWILKPYDSDTPLLTLTLAGGIQIVAPVAPATFSASCLVQVTHDQSSAIAAGFYRDRLRIITSQGIYTTQSRGRIEAVAT